MFHDDRLKRLATVLKALVHFAMVMIPVSLAIPFWGDGLTREDALTSHPELYIWPGVQTWQLAAAMALGAVALLVGLWVLWHMRALFRRYQMGEVITDASALHIRRIGQGLLAVAILPIVVYPLQSILLTMTNPEGQKSVAVAVSFDDIGFLLAGGLLVLIGWAMGEASRMAQDNAAIV